LITAAEENKLSWLTAAGLCIFFS